MTRGGRLGATAWIFAVVCMVALRLAALDADAHPGLSWDTGVFTDEAFYLHNARNAHLFGVERLDDFNNNLIMPTLHYGQRAVFALFGVGFVQARLISVVCSLLTLIVFFAALRRAFGVRAAWIGTLLLGLDHPFLWFNRLGLMDTPAAFLLTVAFYAFVRGIGVRLSAARLLPLVWCGATFGAAYTMRGLAALVCVAPLVALGMPSPPDPLSHAAGEGERSGSDRMAEREKASSRMEEGEAYKQNPKRGTMVWAWLAGLVAVLAVYALVWYLPHRAEIARVNLYYVQGQLIPKTWARLGHNLAQAAYGTAFPGLLPYLLTHTPVLFGLIWVGALKSVSAGATEVAVRARRYLWTWLLVFWLFCAVVNYAPSRYYPMFYPALAGLAGVALAQFSERMRFGRRILAVALCAWGVWNANWIGKGLTHLEYTQRDANRWMASNLPPNSVVFGDVAPALCVTTPFRTVNVIPKLCNDDKPLERHPNAPRYIAILDDLNHEKWWVENYPQWIRPERRVYAIPRLVLRSVVVYDANP